MNDKTKAIELQSMAYRTHTYKHHNIKKQTNFNRFLREMLPTPANYYSKEFPDLKIKSEWVKVLCPFHNDHKPSLNISMINGHFKCHACGASGCDVLAFQRLRYQQSFKEAAIALGAWRQEL